jgi:hypothetical protein
MAAMQAMSRAKTQFAAVWITLGWICVYQNPSSPLLGDS